MDKYTNQKVFFTQPTADGRKFYGSKKKKKNSSNVLIANQGANKHPDIDEYIQTHIDKVKDTIRSNKKTKLGTEFFKSIDKLPSMRHKPPTQLLPSMNHIKISNQEDLAQQSMSNY